MIIIEKVQIIAAQLGKNFVLGIKSPFKYLIREVTAKTTTLLDSVIEGNNNDDYYESEIKSRVSGGCS